MEHFIDGNGREMMRFTDGKIAPAPTPEQTAALGRLIHALVQSWTEQDAKQAEGCQ